MKTLEDFYEDIADSDEYEVTLTLTDFIDADELETSLKAIINSYRLGQTGAFESTCRGFAAMLDNAINERAEKAQEKAKERAKENAALSPSWANEYDERRHA